MTTCAVCGREELTSVELFRAEVVRLYVVEDETVRGIAARTGIHQRTVWRHLEGADVPRRSPGPAPQVIPADELRRVYVTEGLSVAEIAPRLEVNTSLVWRNLDRHGIASRTSGPIPKRQLVDLYVKQGQGITAAARTLGRSDRRVREDLDRYGIPIRSPGRPAEVGLSGQRPLVARPTATPRVPPPTRRISAMSCPVSRLTWRTGVG